MIGSRSDRSSRRSSAASSPGVDGALDGEPEPGAGGPAGAGGLVVGLARHRHEEARNAERDQLVKGVVAGGADRGVEGGEVAAHRVGGAELDHAVGDLAERRQRRGERRDADVVAPGEPAQAARGRLADLRALAERDEDVGPPAGQPELALGALAGEQLGAVEEHDRPDPMGAVAKRHGRAAVLGLGQLARLEHGVEGPGAAERDPARALTPERAPAPDRDAVGRQGAEQRLVGVGAVEDDRVGLGLGDQRAQPGAQAPRPAVVVAGDRGRVGGDVLDREPHLLDHRGGGGEGEEERLDLVAEPAGDRHRAGQVAEPGPVRRREKDPQAIARSRS